MTLVSFINILLSLCPW